MLGDRNSVFYNSTDYYDYHENWTPPDGDYAVITDFNARLDTIRLHRTAASYTLDYSSQGTDSRVRLLSLVGSGTNAATETIAIFENVTGTLNLNSRAFQYV